MSRIRRSPWGAPVLFGVAAAALHGLTLQRIRMQYAGGEPLEVLKAKNDIPAGRKLTRDDITVAHIPERYATPLLVTRRAGETLFGRRVKTSLRAGAWLLKPHIAESLSASAQALAQQVSPGKRIIEIRVLGGRGSAGLVQVGDYVDLAAADAPSEATSIAENLRVLQVGACADSPCSSRRIWVETNPAIALQLSLSAEDYVILLRAPGDHLKLARGIQ